jgi:hypothetical protein
MPREAVIQREAVMREAQVVHNPTANDLHMMRVQQEQERVPVELDEPVYYYNPITPDEIFRIPGTSYFRRFSAGGVVCTTDVMEEAVRAVLAGHGRDKPDRWKGNDRSKPWECKRCGFVTSNENAVDDHRDTGR